MQLNCNDASLKSTHQKSMQLWKHWMASTEVNKVFFEEPSQLHIPPDLKCSYR